MSFGQVADKVGSSLAHRNWAFLLVAIVVGGASFVARQNSPSSSQKSAFGVPLFHYEAVQVTEDTLQRIPAQHANLFAFNTSGPTLRRGECKPLPGDEAWPSKSEWDALNEVLGGALIQTIPIGAACYQDWDAYDAERCNFLLSKWTDPWMHEDDPTSVMWPTWQGNTCLPTNEPGNSTCTIGAFPAYTVNATTVRQIQLAVNFARNKGLRLVIKNTGHDYSGKSCGAGALSIWTHNLQDLDYLADYRQGRHVGSALHVAAGVRSLDIYRFADEKKASVVGGMCGSVGFAGGYFAGGGHSPLSSLFGMAADYILAIGVVTADGRFVTATEETHPDLYWALRGGGAGTFGITTSVIVKLHPKMRLTTSWITFGTSSIVSDETFWQGVRAYFQHFAHFKEAGIYGYINIRRNYKRYNGSSYSLGIEPMMAPNMTTESFDRVIKPFFDKLNDLGIPYTEKRKSFDSFYPGFIDAWPESLQTVTAPVMTEGTRMFPAGVWEDPIGFNRSFEAIRVVSETNHDITGWQIALHNPSNAHNSINPAIRHAVAFFTTGVHLPQKATPKGMAEAQAELEDVLRHWREAAPTSEFGASYLNEASVMEPEWQENFHGSNYAELLRIKRKWDPNEVFYATTAVGSEFWEVRTQEQGLQTQNGPLCRL